MSEKAIELKNKGNSAFGNGDFDIAVDYFSQAIEEDPTNHVLFSNRSAAFAALSKYEEALKDADKCIELNKNFIKGYSRRGAALYGLKRFEDARKAYSDGLALDPNNPACKQGLDLVDQEMHPDLGPEPNEQMNETMNQMNQRMKDALNICKAHPKLSQYLSDPAFYHKVESIQTDPQALITLLTDTDPRVRTLVSVILGVPEDIFSKAAAPPPTDQSYEMPQSNFSQPTTSTPPTASEPPKPTVDPNDPKIKAQALKDQGNKLYKQKKFDEALVCYTRANTLYPIEPTFLLNTAAVFLELGNRCEADMELLRKEAEEGTPVAQTKAFLPDERIAIKRALRADLIAAAEERRRARAAEAAAKKAEAASGVVTKAAEDGEIAADDDEEEEAAPAAAAPAEEEPAEDFGPEPALEDEAQLRAMTTEQLIERKKDEQAAHYQCAMEACEKALQVAEEQNSDYKMKGKIYLRMSNIERARVNYTRALELLQKSMLEHRTDETNRKEKELKELIAKKAEQDYLDPQKGDEARRAGNEEFSKGNFPEAIKFYSDAIRRNPKDARVFSNRAACYQKLMQWSSALDDCDRAIQLDPNFIKPYVRKGNVQTFLKQYPQAMKTFEAALKIDANNADALQGYQELMHRIQQSQSGEADEQQIQEAMKDPEIRAIMSDPVIQNVLQDMQRDPSSVQSHLADPNVASAIGKLMAAGIIKTR